MAPPAPLAKPLVIRARPETIVLVAAATVLTFALSSAIHSRQDAQRDLVAPDLPPVQQQAWAGDLAELSAASPSAPVEPMTSASLVVPKSVLALPSVAVRPLVKLRGCEGSVCGSKTTVPTPMRRPAIDLAGAPVHRQGGLHDKPSLIARLNPFRHLPEMKVIGKPFAYAGNAVSGWFRSF